MPSEFEQINGDVRALGVRLLTIGDALLTRPEDVYVCWPDRDDPPEPNSETSIGIDEPLPTKERIRDLLHRWRSAQA